MRTIAFMSCWASNCTMTMSKIQSSMRWFHQVNQRFHPHWFTYSFIPSVGIPSDKEPCCKNDLATLHLVNGTLRSGIKVPINRLNSP